MVIKCDEEAKKLIAKLADNSLKAYGIQAYNEVGVLINSIQPIAEAVITEQEKEEKNDSKN